MPDLLKAQVIFRSHNDCLAFCEELKDLKNSNPIVYLDFAKKNTKVNTGDFVQFSPYENSLNQELQQGSLVEIEKPTNSFYRLDWYGKPKVIANNITQVILVVATIPKTNFLSIDATLALCRFHNIKPIILINKSDLKGVDEFFEGIERYKSAGANIVFTSIVEEKTMQNLEKYLTGNTSLLFGLSGVGKSSITQYFFPNQKIHIQKLVQKTDKGKHTTTRAELYRNDEFKLIDTAGIGNETISYFDSENLDKLFADFSPFLGECKFRNCKHTIQENDCAIQIAANDKKIHPKRLDAYRLLLQNFCFNKT